jgi:hypothetical protein
MLTAEGAGDAPAREEAIPVHVCSGVEYEKPELPPPGDTVVPAFYRDIFAMCHRCVYSSNLLMIHSGIGL